MTKDEAIKTARACAPYLAESLELYPDMAARFEAEPPGEIADELLASLPAEIGDLDSEMARLRQLKRRLHLIIALADISNIWNWREVTEYLSRLADLSLYRLLRASARAQGIDGTDDNPVPGLFILAVGKYGARELNYSSDIDFNVFYDPEKVALPNPARAERSLIKLVQGVIRGCEAMTEDGYLFRTDLRLRPDPRSTAIAVSTPAAERYYESLGQNWERAAMIKARVCAGDMQTGQDFIDQVLTPFIWRRSLDYAALSDILAIKRQIHAKNGDEIGNVAGHHLKLGAGGIREVEFYAQVQQLILGGREPGLRTPRTEEALMALAAKGFVQPADSEALTAHYGQLRKLEHAAQMMEDEQTHLVPIDADKRACFARLAGYDDLAAAELDIKSILTDVRRIYAELFPEMETLSSDQGNMVFTGVEPDPDTLATLTKLGFENPQKAWADMAGWLGGRIRATRTERARELLTVLAPRIFEFAAAAGQPDRAFEAFSAFITQLSGGVSLLSMFVQAPQRLQYLIELMMRSEKVADDLASRPAIMDAMADPAFLELDLDIIGEEYPARIASADDYEQALNIGRRLVHEDQFRISAAMLSRRMEPRAAAPYFSKVAAQTLIAFLPAAIKEVNRISGPADGQVGILGLGKLGGEELSLMSDLDIMLVYEAGAGEEGAQRYFAKVTQRLIGALSAVTEEGRLYEADMALRPSGRKGPVAVSKPAFETYYQGHAWTWEFMALSRAGAITAHPESWQAGLQNMRDQALLCARDDLDMAADIADMLARVKREKPPRNDWDIKNRDGGLRDIEFIAQKLFLMHRQVMAPTRVTSTEAMLRAALELGALDKKAFESLVQALYLYQNLTQAMSVCIGDIPAGISTSDQENVTWLLGYDDAEALGKALERHCKIVSKYVRRNIS